MAMVTGTVRTVRAPRGRELSCKGWHQEGALRMLMNNLDPEVAERPQDLVVYGGAGKAARNWACFEKIVQSLQSLENDETLLVQSGKAVGIFKTHEYAPGSSSATPCWSPCGPPRKNSASTRPWASPCTAR